MKTKKFLKWPLIIGIGIILNVFFAYAIKVAYPSKDYQDFCPEKREVRNIDNAEECLNQGGQWNEYPGEKEISGFCNQDFQCQKDYEVFRTNYEKNVFIILIVLGTIVFGFSFLSGVNSVLATAFSFGGILTFITASLRYWSLAPDWLNLIILAVALIVLIWLGVRKFQDGK